MKIKERVKHQFKNAINTILNTDKELSKILQEIEKKGIKTSKDKKDQKSKIVLKNKLHDVAYKNTIKKLKEELYFIEYMSNYNSFLNDTLYFNIEINKDKNKKAEIKKKIEESIKKDYKEENFLILPFKDEIKEKIKKEIKEEVEKIKRELEKLNDIIEKNEQLDALYSYLINVTPNKKQLLEAIKIINTMEEDILNTNLETIAEITDYQTAKNIYNKIETFKKLPETKYVTPLKTSILLFNEYISEIENEIIIRKYYKEENFNENYKEIKTYINKIKEILNIDITLTPAQEMLTYSFFDEVVKNIERSKKIPFVRLINTSEVGTGKTFTIPFVSILIASVFLNKYKKNSSFLFITEANLILETYEKLTKELGITPSLVQIITDIDQIKTNPPYKFYLISKTRLQNITKEDASKLGKKIKKANMLLHIIADEASYIKNPASKTSEGYMKIRGSLIKNKAIGFEMLLTATPVSNDTSDIPYIVNPSNLKLSHIAKNDPKYLDEIKEIYNTIIPIDIEKPSIKELAKLAYKFPNKAINIYSNYKIDPSAILVAMHYIKNDKNAKAKLSNLRQPNNSNKKTFIEGTLSKIGFTTTVKEKTLPQHPGKKEISTIVKTMTALEKLSNIKGIDRTLNTNNEGNSVKSNSIILESNLFEVIAFLEILSNARKISNLSRFKRLVELTEQNKVKIKEIENEKFNIRHIILMSILSETEKIKIKTEKVKVTSYNQEDDEEKKVTATFEQLLTKKDEYIEALTEELKDIDKLYEKIVIELDPASYSKIKNLEKEYEKTTSKQQKREIKNQLKRTKDEIDKTIQAIMEQNYNSEDIKEIIKNTIENDIEKIKKSNSYLTEFGVYSLALEIYSKFIKIIEEELLSNPKLHDQLQDPNVREKIMGSPSILETYAVLFQATETLNMPLIFQHISKAAKKLKILLEEKNINIKDFKTETLSKFIREHGSSSTNTIKAVKKFAKEKGIPILAASTYRKTLELLKEEDDLVISGSIPQEKRKEIINQVNKVENTKHLVSSAQAILKGISFFYIPYGIIPESPKNAEFRTQLTGRLRSLFKHHIEEINRANLNERSKYKDLILQNQKYFDIISPEVMVAFPNIQQSKNIMIELTKFISQHKDITGIEAIDTISKEDMIKTFQFNKKEVEKFAKSILEKKADQFVEFLKTRTNTTQISLEEFIRLSKEYIDQITEKNLKKTTLYSLIEETQKITI